ncbi:MAG TPA: serine/threonine-protein kinase [Candidatus Caenarcaniphilales bacterium]
MSLLSAGGFSQTYIAEDIRKPSCPQCLVKHLKPFSQEPDFLQEARSRFQLEAAILEKLGTHEQIPQLLAFFEEDQEFYLVQEFVEGHPYSDELLTGQPLPEADVVELLQDVLSVLVFVHERQVIHRDIKPANLIRRQRDGKLVLIDFGAVKAIQTQIVYPRPTSNIGTPGYTPPEQEAGSPCFSSDLYALGMTAIQALTGLYPNQFIDPQTLKVRWTQKVHVRQELAAVLERMVCYQAVERYPSALACLEAVKTLAEATKLAPATLQLPYLPSISHRDRRSVSLITGIGLLVGVSLMGTILIYFRGQTAQATLDEVKRLQAQEKYQACLDQTKSLLQGFSLEFNFRNQVQELLHQCQSSIDSQRLQKAKRLAGRGKFIDAIAVASQIPDNSKFLSEQVQLINSWTQRLLELGWDQYHAGNLDSAIAYAQTIPTNTPDYQTAQTTLKQWQKHWQTGKMRFRSAEQALKQSQWQQVIQLARQTPSLENHFWQAKLEAIGQRAQAAQQAEDQARAARIERALALLNRDRDQIGKTALQKAYPGKVYQNAEAISELRVRRNGDKVTFRLTAIAQGWFWTTQTIVFDWEVLMLQKRHVKTSLSNGNRLDAYHSEELNNYFMILAEQYL